MKKIYMIFAAIAAMTLGTQAQTVSEGTILVGDYNSPSELYNGSYFDVAPMNFYIAHTGAQLIYTADELADMVDKSDIKVTKLSFKFYNESCFEDMTRAIKVYLQQSDETEFAVVDGKKQFFAFGSKVLDYETTWEMLDLLYEDTELVLDMTNSPFSLTPGKSLIVTVVADGEDCTSGIDECNFYTSGIGGKCMTYTDNNDSFLDYAVGNDFPDATSSLGCGTNVELPVTKIDYTYTDTPTAIDEVRATAAEGDCYNLMGQKVYGDRLPAGIYVKDGKKFLVK